MSDLKPSLTLETDGESELYTLSHNQITHLANGEDVYTEKYMREKLVERYGDHIFFANLGGSGKDVVCFKDMASYIISAKWYQDRNKDGKKESERIMIAAAKIVRSKEYSKDVYPGIQGSEECQDFLTPALRVFLEMLIKDELKCDVLGQAINHASRTPEVCAFTIALRSGNSYITCLDQSGLSKNFPHWAYPFPTMKSSFTSSQFFSSKPCTHCLYHHLLR